jgi:hypothetical protein
MRALLFTSVLLALLLCSVVASAQQPTLPPVSLAKTSNLAFGWISMSGIDPTFDMFTSFAPTMLCVKDAGFTTGVEHLMGAFTFGDFQVNSNFQSVITDLGPGAIRISHYGYDSNASVLPAFGPGMTLQTSGDSIDVSYAKRIGATAVGVTLIPKDSTNVNLSVGNGITMPGESTTDYGARLGMLTPVCKTINVGADYSYQKDSSTLQVAPTTILSGDYLTRCGTVGASWQATPKTLLDVASQRVLAKGTGLDETINLLWFGVTRQLSKHLTARANYYGGGHNVSAAWRTKYGMFIVSYTDHAIESSSQSLGSGHSLFAGVDLAF